MKPIKGLIFDLDYTLYDESRYFLAVIKEFSKKHNFSHEQFWDFFSYENRIKSKDILGDILRSADRYNEAYHEELFNLYRSITVSLELYKGADDILKLAPKNGIKTAIITNGNVQVQKNKIRCLGINERIETIVCARELGSAFDKPHPLPFLTCIKKMGLSSDEVFYIGDNPTVDMVGASKVEIPGILITHDHFKSEIPDCSAKYIVSNFHDLKTLLFNGQPDED